MSKQQMSIIRGSEYQDFLRCRKRWNWRWNEGLRSKQVNDKLFTGTLIHKFLEVLYEKWDGREAVNAMFDLYQETNTEGQDQLQLQEIYQLAFDVSQHYLKTWINTDRDHKTIATELEFLVVLDQETGVVFTGTIDYIFADAEGRIWFMDHKTTTSIDKYEKNSNMDRQISRYWWALKMITQGVGRVKNKETGNWETFEPLLGKEITDSSTMSS
jgi:RecB family exonuclease